MSPVKNTLELNILDSFDRMPNSDQGYRNPGHNVAYTTEVQFV